MTKEDAINYFKRSWAIGEDDGSRYHNEVLEFIIKTLEQKPCEDAISREAVKELFQEGSVMGMYQFLGIDKLPSVTPKKDEWIPCDIRLPKQNEYIGNVCKYYLVQDKYDDMYVARYTKRGWNPIDTLFFLDEVVAWRPLPEPYKAESEDKE